MQAQRRMCVGCTLTSMAEDEDRPQILRAAVKLSRPMRWTALALGLAGLGAGGTSVFITHVEAGPVALLAVGLVLALVGLAGVLPTRLKVGDNEAEFYQEQQRQVATALKEGVEARPAVLGVVQEPNAVTSATLRAFQAWVSADNDMKGIVERVAEVAPQVAAPAQSALEYERMVGDMAVKILSEPDLDVLNSGQRKLLLRGFLSDRQMSFGEISRYHHEAVEAIKGTKLAAVLVVASMEPLSAPAVRALVAGAFPGLYHAVVRGPQDKKVLMLALRNAANGTPLPVGD